ncbi:MAG: radical SAM protein [Candidatus Latescibacteria bacterium]|jgi:putative pyruvate formate lyase activating enzyme|nr:radical SAM protein [Candidatus Latescibacterota bacterium]
MQTHDDKEPGYVKLYESGELERRTEAAVAGLASCAVCPWVCGVNRLEDETQVCRTGRYARVTSCFPHLGEEDPLRGRRGSGTIFFGWCNLRCVFCQNYDISQAEAGVEVRPQQLAEMMLALQKEGCHNINWVTPEHVVPQIMEAMPIAVREGLRLPIVYNTSAFDSLESLRQMDGIVDIYMPDFKYWSEDKSERYLRTAAYPEAAREALKEMHRQVGDLEIDDQGIARRGILLRHLVMPDGLEETRAIMRFLADEISPDTYVNIMAQYHPANRVGADRFEELSRRVSHLEMTEAYEIAREAGLHRFDERQASILRL